MIQLCLTIYLILVIPTSQATLVCPGSNLTLTCLTNGSQLRWVITLPYFYRPEARIISSDGEANSQTPLFENPTLFSFLRISKEPLMSTMLIDNISARLNGTHVDCWFNEGRSTTVIDVVGSAFQSVIQVVSEAFHDENITIVLNWAQGDNEFYTASIVPSAPMFLDTSGSTTIQLTLQYNTHYSVSIDAFLCEYNTTDFVDLYYVNCGMPVDVDTSTIQIDYNSTWINSGLHFRCKEGLLPTELLTATCLENGRWSPNPANHTCAAPSGNNILTPAKRNAVIAAVSSITVCALSSLVFFVVGYACGHKCRHGDQNATCARPDATLQVSQPNPMILYEEILPESNPKFTNQFELEDNVAYDPQK